MKNEVSLKSMHLGEASHLYIDVWLKALTVIG